MVLGLETGHRDICSHVVRQGDIVFVFQSPLNPGNQMFTSHLGLHGDAVKDVAFRVDDARSVYMVSCNVALDSPCAPLLT